MKIIDDSQLADLIRAEAKLAALEAGGVDNWDWYSASTFDSEEGKFYQELRDMPDEKVVKKFPNASQEDTLKAVLC